MLQREGKGMMVPALMGVFVTIAVLSRCGFRFAVVTTGTALSGTILMLTL
jgi:hypothetical protein